MLGLSAPSYQAVKRLLERRAAQDASADTAEVRAAALAQAGVGIRPIDAYRAFFEQQAEAAATPSPATERNSDEHVSH